MLYINPSAQTSEEPVIDELTMKMTAAFRRATKGTQWRGWHTCRCGAHSHSCDYILPNGEQTNSLCIHYLAWHRGEVPQSELDVVAALDFGMGTPTGEELVQPGDPNENKLKKLQERFSSD